MGRAGLALGRAPVSVAAARARRRQAEDGGGRGGGAAGLVLERAVLAPAQRDVGGPGRRAGPAGQRAAVPAGRSRPLRLPAGARHLRRAAALREVSAGPPPGRRGREAPGSVSTGPARGAARWGLPRTPRGLREALRAWKGDIV